jgi:hypothetical protein
VVAPIVLYYGLRAAGAGIYLALVVGALPPGLSAIAKVIKDRTLDGLAAIVIAMLFASTLVSLISGSPRLLLARDGLLTGVWAGLFFASLLARRPVTFRFSQPLLKGRKAWDAHAGQWSAPVAESWDELWERVPRFCHVWRVCTVIWGAALLLDAATRVVTAYTLPVNVVPALGGALWPVTFIVL